MNIGMEWLRRSFRRRGPDAASLIIRDIVGVDELFPAARGVIELPGGLPERLCGAMDVVRRTADDETAVVAERVLRLLLSDATEHGSSYGMQGCDICIRVQAHPTVVYDALRRLHRTGYVRRVDYSVYGPFHGDRSDLGLYWYSIRHGEGIADERSGLAEWVPVVAEQPADL